LKYVMILDFAAVRGEFLSYKLDLHLSDRQKIDEIENMKTCISAVLRPFDLK
jgi:hypothetical protein